MAKNWFKSKDLAFTEHKIGTNGFTRENLLEAIPNARTVPQIVIDGVVIGGWDDLRKSELYVSKTGN
jgi:glutaredoxin